MLTLTVVMIVYCLAFAGLALGISIYRGLKRRREMRTPEGSQPGAALFASSSLPPSSSAGDSPHDTPSAKHAA
jgi:hypothetical protein